MHVLEGLMPCFYGFGFHRTFTFHHKVGWYKIFLIVTCRSVRYIIFI